MMQGETFAATKPPLRLMVGVGSDEGVRRRVSDDVCDDDRDDVLRCLSEADSLSYHFVPHVVPHVVGYA